MQRPRNDRNQAVTRFCLAMEEHRRTDAGRVRTAEDLVAHFFPHDEHTAKDRLFRHMPSEVRGPIVSGWGIRGAKAALKDDDGRVCAVVHDALLAGDVDAALFERGVTAEILVDWIVLAEWWAFWRQGRLDGIAIQKALATARELGLFDDAWFLDHVQGRGGKLRGTDILCETLGKDQVIAWLRRIAEGGDGSPAGIVRALGWETVLAKTSQDALLFALDELAKKVGLVPSTPGGEKTEGPGGPGPASLSRGPDSGMPVAIPDAPVVDAHDKHEDEPPSIPSIPSMEERSVWAGSEESPKLAEARKAMMETLMQTSGGKGQPMPSDTPVDWPEAAAVVAASAAAKSPSEEPIPLSERDLQKASNPKVPVPNPPPVPPRR